MVPKTGGKKHPNHDSLTQFVDYSGKLVTCNLIIHFANLGKFIADISCDVANNCCISCNTDCPGLLYVLTLRLHFHLK